MDDDAKLFLGGCLLCIISAVLIGLTGFFSVNCDETICQINSSTLDQIKTTNYALWIPISFLFVIGIVMISASRNAYFKKLILGEHIDSYFVKLWSSGIFQLTSLTLLISSSYLYSIIVSNYFICDAARKDTLLHCLTGMIVVSTMLTLASIYVFYDFWRETDEQKIENAKKAITEFDKIKTKLGDGDGSPLTTSRLKELEKMLKNADGLSPDTLENIEIKEKSNDIETLIEKNKQKEIDLKTKYTDLQNSKMNESARKIKEGQMNSTLKNFQAKNDVEKFKFICENKKDPQLYDKLMEQIKDNASLKAHVEACCEGETEPKCIEFDKKQAEQKSENAKKTILQEKAKKYYDDFEKNKGKQLEQLKIIKQICDEKESEQPIYLEKILHDYGRKLKGDLNATDICLEKTGPISSITKLDEKIEKLKQSYNGYDGTIAIKSKTSPGNDTTPGGDDGTIADMPITPSPGNMITTNKTSADKGIFSDMPITPSPENKSVKNSIGSMEIKLFGSESDKKVNDQINKVIGEADKINSLFVNDEYKERMNIDDLTNLYTDLEKKGAKSELLKNLSERIKIAREYTGKDIRTFFRHNYSQ